MSYRKLSALLMLIFAAGCTNENSFQQDFNSAVTPNIVNGKVAQPQDLSANGFARSVVRIYVDEGFCTGTLIAPTLVLTAAHCFDGLWDAQNTFIVFQTIDLQKSPPASHTIGVEKFIMHPDYEQNDSFDVDVASKEAKDDLALAVLKYPVPSSVPSAILPQATDSVLSLDGVTAAGYGISSDTYRKGMTGRGLLRSISYPRNELQMKNGMIVTDDRSVAICHGDSGGPLFAGAGRSVKNVVVGVTDFAAPHPSSFFKRLRFNWDVISGNDMESYSKAYPDDELCIGYNGYVDIASHRQWILETAAKLGAPIQ